MFKDIINKNMRSPRPIRPIALLKNNTLKY